MTRATKIAFYILSLAIILSEPHGPSPDWRGGMAFLAGGLVGAALFATIKTQPSNG